MPARGRSREFRARRFAAGAHWGAWLGVLLLGLGEAFRPGFLGLSTRAGWSALLTALVVAALGGGALALIGVLPSPLRRLRPGKGLLALWLLPVLGLLVAVGVSGSESRAGRSTRVVVLGLDGATWEVIDPLIEAGELPHLARLRRQGATGILRSEEPTLSPQLWTTMATGVGPEHHGVVDFFSTQDLLRAPRIWEIVAASGEPVGVWEWLVTWPPDQLEGFVVPGWLLRGPETWPPELAAYQRLRDGPAGMGPGQLAAAAWWSYRNGLRLPTLLAASSSALRLKLMSPADREASPLQTLVHGDIAVDLFLHHWQRLEPRFGALILYGTDSLGHRYWTGRDRRRLDTEEETRRGDPSPALRDAYRQGDRALGRLMGAADERTLIVLVSDHGMQAMDEEYSHYAVRADRLIDALGMSGRLTAFSVGRLLQLSETGSAGSGIAMPDCTRALELVEVDGEPLFTVRPTSPRDVLVQVSGNPPLDRTVRIGDRPVALAELFFTTRFTGEHTLDGVIGFWGAGVSPGAQVHQATLRDLAPTLLTVMGLPLSREMDGRVLRDAFAPALSRRLSVRRIDSYNLERQARQTPLSSDDREEIERRLRALGYVQ